MRQRVSLEYPTEARGQTHKDRSGVRLVELRRYPSRELLVTQIEIHSDKLPHEESRIFGFAFLVCGWLDEVSDDMRRLRKDRTLTNKVLDESDQGVEVVVASRAQDAHLPAALDRQLAEILAHLVSLRADRPKEVRYRRSVWLRDALDAEQCLSTAREGMSSSELLCSRTTAKGEALTGFG